MKADTMDPTAATLPPARRLLAALLAACVFALAALTASPEWHAALHSDHGGGGESAHRDGSDHGDNDEHSCAVTLFTGGVEAPPMLLAVPKPDEHADMAVRAADTAKRGGVAHRFPPSCGPPTMGPDNR